MYLSCIYVSMLYLYIITDISMVYQLITYLINC